MKLSKKIILYSALLAATVVVFHIPVTTKQGVDYVVSTKKIPLYVKIYGFLYRDYQYRNLSRRITKGVSGDRDKVMSMYDWTLENIKKMPEGLPVIDDHIWNIIIREHGTADQMADVFTALASYAGYESFWVEPNISAKHFIPSFVKIGGRWQMFDLYNKRYFISAETLKLSIPGGPSYGEYLESMDKRVFEPRIRRADKQKLLPRISYEAKELFR